MFRGFKVVAKDIGLIDWIDRSLRIFPWSASDWFSPISDSDFERRQFAPVIAGTASERRKAMMNRRLDLGELCERCGRDLSARPWDRIYASCGECYDLLQKDYGRTWRMRDNSLSTTQDRILIEMNRPEALR